MSSVPASFPFGAPTEPTFELALRGYEKRQVDRYVQQVEAEVAALTAEREELYAQINVLNQHVQQMQQEVANARRLMTTPGEGLTYRHLGARAEQILALAEEQAAEIRDRVTRELAEKEAALARTRAELDARAKDAANNFEQLLASRRAEEEQAATKRREALAAEVETAKAYAARVRSDVDALYTAALQESTRVGDATKAYADKVRDETEAHAAQVRAQVEEEAAQQRAALATELAALRSAAETELATLRASATAEINIHRAEAEAVVAARLAEVETLAAERAAVLDAELTKRRVDSEQEHAERRTTVERELAEIEAVATAAVRELRADAEAYAASLRSQADDHLAAARTSAERLGLDAEESRRSMLAEAEALAGQGIHRDGVPGRGSARRAGRRRREAGPLHTPTTNFPLSTFRQVAFRCGRTRRRRPGAEPATPVADDSATNGGSKSTSRSIRTTWADNPRRADRAVRRRAGRYQCGRQRLRSNGSRRSSMDRPMQTSHQDGAPATTETAPAAQNQPGPGHRI